MRPFWAKPTRTAAQCPAGQRRGAGRPPAPWLRDERLRRVEWTPNRRFVGSKSGDLRWERPQGRPRSRQWRGGPQDPSRAPLQHHARRPNYVWKRPPTAVWTRTRARDAPTMHGSSAHRPNSMREVELCLVRPARPQAKPGPSLVPCDLPVRVGRVGCNPIRPPVRPKSRVQLFSRHRSRRRSPTCGGGSTRQVSAAG